MSRNGQTRGAKFDAPMPRAKAAELDTIKSSINTGTVRNLIMFCLSF